MALRTFVKISNVSNLSDARYCAGMGVDQLGFNLNPADSTSIDPTTFMELKDWIAGVQLVGEFSDLAADEIIQIQQSLPLDMIEVSGISTVEKIHLIGKPVSVRIRISNETELGQLNGHLSYLDELADQVIITSNDETLFDAITQSVQSYHGPVKLIKGYDINSQTIERVTNFNGIQLEGSEEEKPGFKEYGEIMDLLEALEVD